MLIIKDFTVKTIQEICRLNNKCDWDCPFYAGHFGYSVYFDTASCIFESDSPRNWPMATIEDDEDE